MYYQSTTTAIHTRERTCRLEKRSKAAACLCHHRGQDNATTTGSAYHQVDVCGSELCVDTEEEVSAWFCLFVCFSLRTSLNTQLHKTAMTKQHQQQQTTPRDKKRGDNGLTRAQQTRPLPHDRASKKGRERQKKQRKTIKTKY